MAYLWKSREKLLNHKGPELIKKISLDAMFYANLVKYEVLQRYEIEDLKTDKPSEQKRHLVGTLHNCSKYIGFIKSLLASEQKHIVSDILQEDICIFTTTEDITVIERSLEEVIRAEKTDKNESQHQDQSHDIARSKSSQKASTSNEKDKRESPPHQDVLTSHNTVKRAGQGFGWLKQHYLRTLSRSPVYEHTLETPWYEIEQTFTRLILHSTIQTREPSLEARLTDIPPRKEIRKIERDELFCNRDGEYLSILVEGKPGCGKSTLFKYSVLEWASGKSHLDGNVLESRSHTIHDYKKELVIFVDKRHEGQTLDETLTEALRVSSNENAFEGPDFLIRNPQKCLIFYDGLDEFSNKGVVDEILEMVKRRKPHILVSCRSGHPYIRGKQSLFKKNVEVVGFNSEEASSFIIKYMQCINQENPIFGRQIGENLASLLYINERHQLSENPLNIVLLCHLYKAGDISDEDIMGLTLLDLYKHHQEALILHESSKRALAQTGSINNEHRIKTKQMQVSASESIKAIQRMALLDLLGENKQGMYTKEQLMDFGVDLSSPVMILFHQEQHQSEEGEENTLYSWPHETMREFHAAEAVQEKDLLLAIASKSELSHVLKFLVPMLAEKDSQVPMDFLSAVLLLQSSLLPCSKKGWVTQKFTSFFKQEHKCEKVQEVQKILADAFKDSDDIEAVLVSSNISVERACELPKVKNVAKCVQNQKWGWKNLDTFETVMEAIGECKSPDVQMHLFDNIIRPCLPSVVTGEPAAEPFSYHQNASDDELSDDDDDDDSDDDLPKFTKPLFRGIKWLGKAAVETAVNVRAELHAVIGAPRLLAIVHGHINKMVVQVIKKFDEDFEDEDEMKGEISIHAFFVSDITRTRDVIRDCAGRLSGNIKQLMLKTGEDSELGCIGSSPQEGPQEWKKTILFLAEVFKLDMEVPEIPDLNDPWPGEDDIRALQQNGVHHFKIGDRVYKI